MVIPRLYRGEFPGILAVDLMKQVGTCEDLVLFRFDTPDGFQKNIWMQQGLVVSASSTQDDDRLGEILYQQGLLSLNALVDIAGSISKSKRLGEVLIEKKWFSHDQIHNALKDQCLHILMSLLFNDTVFVEIWHEPESSLHHQYFLDLQDFPLEGLQTESRIVKKFGRHCDEHPLLIINKNPPQKKLNDFWQDILATIEEFQNYHTIKKNIRFSPLYFDRFLYSLFRAGYLEDTHHFGRNIVSRNTYQYLQHKFEQFSFIWKSLMDSIEDSNNQATLKNSYHTLCEKYFGFSHLLESPNSYQVLLNRLLPACYSCYDLTQETYTTLTAEQLSRQIESMLAILMNIASDLESNKDSIKKIRSLIFDLHQD